MHHFSKCLPKEPLFHSTTTTLVYCETSWGYTILTHLINSEHSFWTMLNRFWYQFQCGWGEGFPHTNKQFSGTSWVSYNSAIYPEIASNSTGYGFSPTRLPPYPFTDILSAPLSTIIMDSLFLLLALQWDTHLLSSWWTEPFIIMK